MRPRLLVLASLAFLALSYSTKQSLAQTSAIDSVRQLLAADQDERALAFARAAVQSRPQEAAAHCAHALALNAAGELEAAIEAGDRCVELEPDASEHQLILGEALMELAGERGGLGALAPAKRGKTAMERAIELDPGNLAARLQLVFFHINAPGIAGGSKEEAARQADAIERRDPVMGVYVRYQLRVEEAGDDELSQFFNTAFPLVGTAGDSAGYAVGTATSVVANVEDLALSERLVAQLYAAYADDPRVSYARARIWALEGQELDKAEQLLLAYIDLPELPRFAPSHAGAHWRLGTVYEKQGRKSDALASYKTAVGLEPDFRQAREDAERLAKELGQQ